MEQVRLVKALEPDAEWERDVDKAAAGWTDRLPRVRVGNACVRSVGRRPPTWQDSPATR